MDIESHPFARFVNILGRGKSLTRALTQDEAREAMGMILDGAVLPEQLGAFLMLLRVKEETGEEIAGFVEAARARFAWPADAPVELDWPSYAGKSRQANWYVLAALLIAASGKRVLMHGHDGHAAGRVFSTDALRALGVAPARDAQEAVAQLDSARFAYLPLTAVCPKLASLLEMRPVLGLRSAANTVARALDPCRAKASLIGVFHPGYMDIHRDAALALGGDRALIFRGDGGEGERRPAKPCEWFFAAANDTASERWPSTTKETAATGEPIDIARLGGLWRGETTDDYGEAAVIGTVALALKAMGEAAGADEAHARARDMWAARDRARIVAVR